MSLLRRQLQILDVALVLSMRRRRKNAALLIVFTLLVALAWSLALVVRGIRTEAADLLAEAPDLVVQRVTAGRHDLVPASLGEQVRRVAGVRSVHPRLWGYYFDQLFGANYTLVVPPANAPEVGTVRVGSGLERSSMAAVGNIMPLRTHAGQLVSLTVTEVYGPAADLVAADLVVMAAADYRMLFGIPAGMANDLVVELAADADESAVAREIERRLPGHRAITRREMLATYEAIASWRNGAMPALIAGLAGAMLILLLDRASGLTADDQREVGVLRALGWGTADILALKCWEGLVIALPGVCGGLVLGYLHIHLADGALFAPVLRGWAVLAPRLQLSPSIFGGELALLLVLAVAPYSLAAMLPVWRSAKGAPDAILRS